MEPHLLQKIETADRNAVDHQNVGSHAADRPRSALLPILIWVMEKPITGRIGVIDGRMNHKDQLIFEIDRLEKHLPKWAVRFLSAVMAPKAFWLRVPLAVLLIAGGAVGFFLPVPAFWMLPLGLALLALDLPFLRSPMARLLAFINRKLNT